MTANKHLLAHHGPELERTSRAADSPLRFEAAVGGGIPVLGPLALDLAANRVARVRGIVNGTTNFILTAMAREGRDYARRPRRGPGARLRGGRPDRRRRGPRRRQQARDPRPARVRRLDRSRRGRPTGRARRAAATGRPGITGVTAERRRRDGGRGPRCCGSSRRPGSPTDGAIEASVVPTAVPAGRRSGAATACSTGSRSTPSRWAGWRSRVRAPAGPRRRRRCSATSSRSRAGSARRGPGRPPATRAIGARRAPRRVRMRRGAVRRLLPVRGLRRL